MKLNTDRLRNRIIKQLDNKFYPDFEDNWDDKLLRNEILRVMHKDQIVLDLGAGAGIVDEMNFRGKVFRVCGIDPDRRVCSNPFLDESKIALGEES